MSGEYFITPMYENGASISNRITNSYVDSFLTIDEISRMSDDSKTGYNQANQLEKIAILEVEKRH